MQAGRLQGSESARMDGERYQGEPRSVSGENVPGRVFFLTLIRNSQGFLRPVRVEVGKAPTFSYDLQNL